MEVDILWLRLLARAEDICDELSRRTRHFLPTVARFCLTATFFEDGLRVWFDWHDHLSHLELQLHCSPPLALAIVVINLVGQLLGCALVLLRRFVNVAVTLLAGIVLLQVHLNAVPWQLELLLRQLSLLGGLLLLHVEARKVPTSIYCTGGGLPLLVDVRPQQYLKLTGRILLAFMYLTLLRFDLEFLSLALNALGVLLMALIVLGLRTRLAALALALLLSLWNVFTNAWWWLAEDPLRDSLKYDCFHTLSVVGGLLLVVVLGPGHVSLEQYKKQW